MTTSPWRTPLRSRIDHDSVASFDNLAAVPKSVLTVRLGALAPDGGHRIRAALDAMADC